MSYAQTHKCTIAMAHIYSTFPIIGDLPTQRTLTKSHAIIGKVELIKIPGQHNYPYVMHKREHSLGHQND
jgi:hypothetical protein